MGTIYRNPVPGRSIPDPLSCGARHCASVRATISAGESFYCRMDPSCPDRNRGFRVSFLYPRKRRDSGSWHHHQGIDISGQNGVTPIISVVSGEVVHVNNVYESGYGGYGKTVIIRGDNGIYYFHGHCHSILVNEGNRVSEQQNIALVGCTDYSASDPTSEMAVGAAHLHFEVARTPYPKGTDQEYALDGDHGSGRLDPRAHLESLGQWGPQRFYFPIVTGATTLEQHEVNATRVEALFRATEQEHAGGYFPMGANNLWHGGVHLPGTENALVRAPFDGTILAARLDPDGARARRAFGSVNFILLRHEIPDHIYRQLQRSGSESAGASEPQDSVGRYVGSRRRGPTPTNPPELVVEVKRMLHECLDAEGHPYYHPSDPALLTDGNTIDDGFVDAIVRFQTDIPGRRWQPDGVVTVGSTTWNELRARVRQQQQESRAGSAAGSEDERASQPNILYSLFMHLGSEALNNALAERIPWLRDVETQPTEAEAEQERQRQADLDRERQQAEADDPEEERTYAMTNDVGPRRCNNAADVEWVQRRLSRHGFYQGAADGHFSDTLQDAIIQFQERHVPYYRDRRRRGDAQVGRNQSTAQTLARTRWALEHEDTAGGTESAVDQRFLRRLQQQNGQTGVANVVTDISCRVVAGDVLWTIGTGLAFSPTEEEGGDAESTGTEGTEPGSDSGASQPLLHWELFSEEALVAAWNQVDDDTDDDLTIDVVSLIEQVEGETGPRRDGLLDIEEVRAFYRSERSHNCRQTQFRFCSEWGLNLDNTIRAIRACGWSTDGLRERLLPYIWWREAGNAVPNSPLVWHYNPIAFMALYLEQFPRGSTTESSESPADEEDESSTPAEVAVA